MKIETIEGTVTFEDGQRVKFLIETPSEPYYEGSIFRWGNTTEVVGRAVDVTEAMERAVRDTIEGSYSA